MSVAFLGYLGLKEETTYGLEATPPAAFGEITSESIAMDNGLIIPEGCSGTRFTKRILPGAITCSGNITVPLYPEDLTGYILKGVLGNNFTSSLVASGVYEHTFLPEQTSRLPSFTVEVDAEAMCQRWLGCNFGGMTISVAPNDLVNMSVDVVAQYPKAVSPSSPVFGTLDPFTGYDVAISIEGVSNIDFEAMEITISNELEGVSTLNNQRWISKNVAKGLKVEGSFSLELGDSEFVEYLWGAVSATQPQMSLTPIELVLTITSQADIETGYPYRVIITIPNVYLATAPYNLTSANARVMQNVTFVTRYDSVTQKQIEVKLRNSQSTY